MQAYGSIRGAQTDRSQLRNAPTGLHSGNGLMVTSLTTSRTMRNFLSTLALCEQDSIRSLSNV